MDRGVKQLKQSRSSIMKFPVFLKESWVYLGAGRLDVTKISSPFHQYHSGDQHKPNFGTKFLLRRWDCSNPHFQGIFPKHYSRVTIHHLLFIGHYSSFYYSSFSESVCDSEKRYYSCDTIHSGGKTLFMHIIHFVVIGDYGYSYSRNWFGLAANSCIICRDISFGLEIVYISSR